MIRRLIAYLRGPRQPTTAPTEPHSQPGPDASDTHKPAPGEHTAFDRLVFGPDAGAAPAAVPLLDVSGPVPWYRPIARLRAARAAANTYDDSYLISMRDDRCAEDIGWDLVARECGRRLDQAAFNARWRIAEAVDRFEHGEQVAA